MKTLTILNKLISKHNIFNEFNLNISFCSKLLIKYLRVAVITKVLKLIFITLYLFFYSALLYILAETLLQLTTNIPFEAAS